MNPEKEYSVWSAGGIGSDKSKPVKPPPVDNSHVEEGCERFKPSQEMPVQISKADNEWNKRALESADRELTASGLKESEPIPTRAALFQALKEDLESFEFLESRLRVSHDYGPLLDCITDAIARINDMLNVENARVMGEEKK